MECMGRGDSEYVAQQVARGNIQPISGAYAALVENSDC